MKISFKLVTPTSLAKISKKVKQVVSQKTEQAAKDSFVKRESLYGGVLTRREFPNMIGVDEDYHNNTYAITRHYYPEDVEKMNKMSVEERIEYKRNLDKQGKYYESEDGNLTLEEVRAFLKKMGISEEKVLIKRNKMNCD